ncbi:hypothetical protein PR048_013305 [Dryococelus australis]|uniref:PiggyBac transposable element-derived protein domain-containing protein n=1 Tax=Dryococelus australis TaxID=614101 RepID=A0ABQ9HS38_9NEOP|nr:hypothetical protein PR048_013305 [Dryococelus australis]
MVMVQTIFNFQTINKIENKTLETNSNTGEGLGEKFVQNLLKDFEKSGRIIYTDSFFSSPNLFSFLLENGIGGYGTFRCY